MNRRIRTRSPAVDGHLRYLKPGALAQLRYKKINSRTHHRSSDIQIYLSRAIMTSSPESVSLSPSRSLNVTGSAQQPETPVTIAVADGESPNVYSVRSYGGPRCPQRKKLMAVRSMFHSEPSDSSPEPAIDAAH